MDQNIGLEAKISQEGIRITIMIDLQEIFRQLIGISLQGQTSHMGITIRTMEDHMINAKISQSVEVMEIDLETNLSTIRKGTGETMGNSLVLHWLRGETILKIVQTASPKVINLTILFSADLTISLWPGLHPMSKFFHKAKTRVLLIWFLST